MKTTIEINGRELQVDEQAAKELTKVIDQRYKAVEALKKVGAGGGMCSDDDDCPYCIADKALEELIGSDS